MPTPIKLTLKDNDVIMLRRVGEQFEFTFAGSVKLLMSTKKWQQFAELILAPADKKSILDAISGDGVTQHQTEDEYRAIRASLPQDVQALIPADPMPKWRRGEPLRLG